MDRELLAAQSGGKLLPKRVLFLETIQTKEHSQISNASFWKRGRENVFLQMFSFGEIDSTPQIINGNKVVRAVMLLQGVANMPRAKLGFISARLSSGTQIPGCGLKEYALKSVVSRVEFLLKTESGYLRDTGVTWFTLANP